MIFIEDLKHIFMYFIFSILIIIFKFINLIERIFVTTIKFYSLETYTIFKNERAANYTFKIITSQNFIFNLEENTLFLYSYDSKSKIFAQQLNKELGTQTTSEKDENNQLLILSLWDFHYIIKITNNGLFINYSLSNLNSYFSLLSYYFLFILFHIFPTVYLISLLSKISQTTTNNRTLIEFLFSIDQTRQFHKFVTSKHVNLTLSELVQLFFYNQPLENYNQYELTVNQQVLYQYIYKSPNNPKINDKEYVRAKVCELINANKQQRLVIKMLAGLASELEKQVVQQAYMNEIVKEYDFKVNEKYIKKKLHWIEYLKSLLLLSLSIIVYLNSKILLVLLITIYTLILYIQNKTPVELVRLILVTWTLVTFLIKAIFH